MIKASNNSPLNAALPTEYPFSNQWYKNRKDTNAGNATRSGVSINSVLRTFI
jgi:hypothetical protein